MSNEPHEKRRYSRAPFDSDVTLIDPDTQWQGKLIDISIKGALVERPQGWEGEIGDQYALDGGHTDHPCVFLILTCSLLSGARTVFGG